MHCDVSLVAQSALTNKELHFVSMLKPKFWRALLGLAIKLNTHPDHVQRVDMYDTNREVHLNGRASPSRGSCIRLSACRLAIWSQRLATVDPSI